MPERGRNKEIVEPPRTEVIQTVRTQQAHPLPLLAPKPQRLSLLDNLVAPEQAHFNFAAEPVKETRGLKTVKVALVVKAQKILLVPNLAPYNLVLGNCPLKLKARIKAEAIG